MQVAHVLYALRPLMECRHEGVEDSAGSGIIPSTIPASPSRSRSVAGTIRPAREVNGWLPCAVTWDGIFMSLVVSGVVACSPIG
ncbi:MAG: hypothetical protein F4X92_06110 [Gammaproteobacteria bacterium]|nr:hypothetical protein [Gammaproteobacteria bacterium]